MIERFNLIQNIGLFDSTSFKIDFTKVSLLYAENGRGKTTVASILQSLKTGDAKIILDRKSLGSLHPPKVVVNYDGSQIIFDNNSWSKTIPNMAIFDDNFVANNICWGIELNKSHRQNLHELILGSQGVNLNNALQSYIKQIAEHNQKLHIIQNKIPSEILNLFPIDKFCDLADDPDIDSKIKETESKINAAQESGTINERAEFAAVSLPRFDIEKINEILRDSTDSIGKDAVKNLQQHLNSIGTEGESWIAQGMSHVTEEGHDNKSCPFCAQDLSGSNVFELYQEYFSEGYKNLKKSIKDFGVSIKSAHGQDASTLFERNFATLNANHEFWKKFVQLPEIKSIDTAEVSSKWKIASEAVLQQLRAKMASPLESTELLKDTLDKVAIYHEVVSDVDAVSRALIGCNEIIKVKKTEVKTDNVESLKGELKILQAKKARHIKDIKNACDEYMAERQSKKTTKTNRDQARDRLDIYRREIFPRYQSKINDYLNTFGAEFRIGKVAPVNRGTGSFASYCVVINNVDVNVESDNGPSFKTTLSAGDRNTLALAFFFASLELDADIKEKIVVIDDPMTSLDENRTQMTYEVIRDLEPKICQLIILSHSVEFLFNFWNYFTDSARSAFQLIRGQNVSTFEKWDIDEECLTEHYKNYRLVREYLYSQNPNTKQDVAEALRLILEEYIKVVFPLDFSDTDTLGQFYGKCISPKNELLDENEIKEFKSLMDYVNQFHHSRKKPHKSTFINDSELKNYSQRVLNFISKKPPA